MNRIFKVVFNRVLGRHVVVSEVSRNQGKGSSGSIKKTIAVMLAAGAALAVSGNALADPVSVESQVSGSSNFTESEAALQTVFGYGNTTSATYATAWGEGTTANTEASTAFGHSTVAGQGKVIRNTYISDWWTEEKSGGGNYATAFGKITQALGEVATAFGEFTVANGDQATAFGHGTVAEGVSSTAFGQQTRATGPQSTAFGNASKATETNATAFGQTTIASGQNSTAFGGYSIASGMNSTAFGQYTEANGTVATAWGYGTSANKVVASGVASTAFGAQTKAGRQLYEGKVASIQSYIDESAPSYNNTRYKIVDKDGKTLKDSFQTYAQANQALTRKDYATAWGLKTDAAGTASTAFGNLTEASGTMSTSFGQYTEASGKGATAFGIGTANEKVHAVGTAATSFGSSTVAAGDYSTAFGVKSKAYGENSLAALGGTTGEGTVTQNVNAQTGQVTYTVETTESANAAVAIGEGALAQKDYTYAIGKEAKAEAANTIAIGNGSTVSGENSIAFGNGHTITGANSGAFGDPTIINGENSYSVGNSNEIGEGYTDVFALGNSITEVESNSVFLGSGAAYVAAGDTTGGLGEVSSATINGITYGNFAGATPTGVVSVGGATDSYGIVATRRIQNVAAGLISADSTDAINGSQLYQALQASQFEIKAGDNITVETATDEKTGIKTYTISSSNATAVAEGNNVTVDGPETASSTTSGGGAAPGSAGTSATGTDAGNGSGTTIDKGTYYTDTYTVNGLKTEITSDDGSVTVNGDGKPDDYGIVRYDLSAKTYTAAQTGEDGKDYGTGSTTLTIKDSDDNSVGSGTISAGENVKIATETDAYGNVVNAVISAKDTDTTYTVKTEGEGTGTVVATTTVTDSNDKEVGKFTDTDTTYTVKTEGEGTGTVVATTTVTDSNDKEVGKFTDTDTTYTVTTEGEGTGTVVSTTTVTNSNGDKVGEFKDTDTTYTAGENVQISDANVISATDTQYELSSEKSEKAADGSTTYTITLKDKDGNDAGSAEVIDTDTRNKVVAGNNVSITADGDDTEGPVTYTINGKDTVVEAGKNVTVDSATDDKGVTTYTINATGGGIAEIAFNGDTGDTVENPKTLNVVGGVSDESQLTEGNIGVVADGKDTLTVKLNKDVNLGEGGSVTVGDTKIENNKVTVGDTTITGDTVTTTNVKSETVEATTVNATTVNSTNVNSTNVTATTVKAGNTTINNNGMTINNGPTITTTNVDMNNQQIHNVAAGTAAGDAVNVSQLKQTEANFDQKLNHLNGRIGEVAQDANAGIAMALAAASLPQAYLPGKSMMAVAGGTYRGEQGYAIGFSTVSDNGKWIIKANATGNSQGHYGAAVGAGYMW